MPRRRPAPGFRPTPVRPPTPAAFAGRVGKFTLGRVVWWWDLADWAVQNGPLGQQPVPGVGWDMSGWTHLISCGRPPGYLDDFHWRWDSPTTTPPVLCLAGQAVSNIDNVPLTTHKTLRYWWKLDHPTLNRFAVREWWTRAATGPVPDQNVGRAGRYSPSTGPHHWPVDLPLPDIYTLPNGAPAPTPLPTPYPWIPLRPIIWATPGFEGDQRGNYADEPAIVGVGTQVFPNPQPQPNPKPQPRPRDRVRERKKKFATAAAGFVWRKISDFTESVDVVRALYSALPAAVRRQVRRENGGYITPVDQAEALWRHWNEIDVETAIRSLIKQQVTDYLYGAPNSRASRWYGENTGSPFGPQAGPWDETMREALDEMGNDLDLWGSLFDEIEAVYNRSGRG